MHVVTKLIVLRGLLVVRLRLVIGRRWVVRGWGGMDGMMSQRSGMNGMSEWGSMDGMRDRSGMEGMMSDWESVVRGVVTRGHDHSPVADGRVVSDVSQDSRHEGAQGGCYLQ